MSARGGIVTEENIATSVALRDKSERSDGTFSRLDVPFDPAMGSYTCPVDKGLLEYRKVRSRQRPLWPSDSNTF